MGQIIKSLASVILSACQSVCKHFYSCNFDSILMKFCTVIRGSKSKIGFVWDKNLMTSSQFLPQFLKICITAYGDFKVVPVKDNCALFTYPLFSGSDNLMVLFKFTPYRPLLP